MRLFRDTHRLSTQIDGLIDQARSSDDEELQSHLAKYACILVNAYLEFACREALLRYASPRAGPAVVGYVEGQLERFRNPNIEKVLHLVRSFEPRIGERLAQKIEGDQKTKDGVDSIAAVRNQLAHGRPAGISLGRIQQYYEAAKTLVTWLDSELR